MKKIIAFALCLAVMAGIAVLSASALGANGKTVRADIGTPAMENGEKDPAWDAVSETAVIDTKSWVTEPGCVAVEAAAKVKFMYDQVNLYVHYEAPIENFASSLFQLCISSVEINNPVDLGSVNFDLANKSCDNVMVKTAFYDVDGATMVDAAVPFEIIGLAAPAPETPVYIEMLTYFNGGWLVWNMNEEEQAAYAHCSGTSAYGTLILSDVQAKETALVTDVPDTLYPADETTEETEETTESVQTTDTEQKDTQKKAETSAVSTAAASGEDDDGGNTGLIIGIIAAAVVIIAAVAVILIKKKKK